MPQSKEEKLQALIQAFRSEMMEMGLTEEQIDREFRILLAESKRRQYFKGATG